MVHCQRGVCIFVLLRRSGVIDICGSDSASLLFCCPVHVVSLGSAGESTVKCRTIQLQTTQFGGVHLSSLLGDGDDLHSATFLLESDYRGSLLENSH